MASKPTDAHHRAIWKSGLIGPVLRFLEIAKAARGPAAPFVAAAVVNESLVLGDGRRRFEYVADEDAAIEYLRLTHDKVLPKVFARPDDPQDEPEIVIPVPV